MGLDGMVHLEVYKQDKFNQAKIDAEKILTMAQVQS